MKNHVRDAWYVAGWERDLPRDKPIQMWILGEPIVLWRAENRVVAMADRCVHRLAPLSQGRCEGAKLRCMYHGILFDAEGQASHIPGQEKIPPKARVKTYPVVSRHSWLWVWMGEPERADPALIPKAIGFDDPEWLLDKDSLDYDAEARLINDNLLDLTHGSFLHGELFGVDERFFEAFSRITQLDRGVRIERWLRGQSTPGTPPGQASTDMYMTYDYMVPGILSMWMGNFPAGTADTLDNARPGFSQAISGLFCANQAVTQMGDKATRYFFSTGPRRDHGDEKVRDILMSTTRLAFADDKRMIEGQQAIIDALPGNPMPLIHDRPSTIFDHIVARLLKEERSSNVEAV